MTPEAQLAELRAQIAVLAGRRLADHPVYRAWLTDSTFEVDGYRSVSMAFIERDVVVVVAAVSTRCRARCLVPP